MSYKLSKQQKIYPIELPCKKTMYDSEAEAREMIEYLKKKKGIKEDLRCYGCVKCGKYHLTSNQNGRKSRTY